MLNVDDRSFGELFESDKVVVVDLWADWCVPCKNFAPTFEAAAEKHTDLTFAKVQIDNAPGVANKYGVMAIPTVLFLNPDGTEIDRFTGVLSATQFEEALSKVK